MDWECKAFGSSNSKAPQSEALHMQCIVCRASSPPWPNVHPKCPRCTQYVCPQCLHEHTQSCVAAGPPGPRPADPAETPERTLVSFSHDADGDGPTSVLTTAPSENPYDDHEEFQTWAQRTMGDPHATELFRQMPTGSYECMLPALRCVALVTINNTPDNLNVRFDNLGPAPPHAEPRCEQM